MRNNKIVIILIIIALIALATGGYFGYKYFNLKDKQITSDCPDCKECTSDNENINDTEHSSEYNLSLEKRKNVQMLRPGEGFRIIIDLAGDVYIDYKDYNGTISNEISKNIKEYEPKGYFDPYYIGNGTPDKTVNAYKLNVKGVLYAYDVLMGNGGYRYIIFIKENGMLSYLQYDSLGPETNLNNNVEVVDIENLKNVISIIDNEFNMSPSAILNDGTEVVLSDYIK